MWCMLLIVGDPTGSGTIATSSGTSSGSSAGRTGMVLGVQGSAASSTSAVDQERLVEYLFPVECYQELGPCLQMFNFQDEMGTRDF